MPTESASSDLPDSPGEAPKTFYPGTTSQFFMHDDEAVLGLSTSPSTQERIGRPQSPSHASFRSQQSDGTVHSPFHRFRRSPSQALKRRPTAVRVVSPDRYTDEPISLGTHREIPEDPHRLKADKLRQKANERTPLIKAGVIPDLRKSVDDAQPTMDVVQRAEVGLGRMVELGLPLIM